MAAFGIGEVILIPMRFAHGNVKLVRSTPRLRYRPRGLNLCLPLPAVRCATHRSRLERDSGGRLGLPLPFVWAMPLERPFALKGWGKRKGLHWRQEHDSLRGTTHKRFSPSIKPTYEMSPHVFQPPMKDGNSHHEGPILRIQRPVLATWRIPFAPCLITSLSLKQQCNILSLGVDESAMAIRKGLPHLSVIIFRNPHADTF